MTIIISVFDVERNRARMTRSTKVVIATLLAYVFFREFRPSEAFLTPYLTETKNLTKTSVYNEIYPVWSYSQLPVFILVLATTDFLRFRPVIWAGAVGYVATWIILILGKTVRLMELMQVTYALGTACEVAYKSYVFVAVSKAQYSVVSLYLSAAALLGRSLSSLSSQVLHDYLHVSFLQLNYISLGSVSLAFIISWFIPSPAFSKETPLIEPAVSSANGDDADDVSVAIRYCDWMRSMSRDVVARIAASYRSRSARRWAYWGIVTSAMYFMVGNTAQSLWKDLENGTQKRYNGYVIALNALLCSATSYMLGRYSKRVEKTKGSLIAGLVLVMSVTTLIPTMIQNLYLAYLCDAVFNILVSSAITISTFKMAHSLTSDLYGFVVGMNACVAGMIDLVVTLIVADERVLDCTPRQQYRVYTGFGVCVAVLYFVHKCCAAVALRDRTISVAQIGTLRVGEDEDEEYTEFNRQLRGLDNGQFEEDNVSMHQDSDCEIIRDA